MIGVVLAAGAGRRLRPDTGMLPKTLLPVAGETTILDIGLRNLAAAGLCDVVIVVGHGARVISDRSAGLERAHGVTLTLVHNDRADEWNNAYSLWLAREYFGGGCCSSTGTRCIRSACRRRCSRPRTERAGQADTILAVDNVKPLGEEEMKVAIDRCGLLRQDHQADGPRAGAR